MSDAPREPQNKPRAPRHTPASTGPARDGPSRAELEAVADVAMLGWDARTGGARD